MVYGRRQLNAQLPGDLRTRIEQTLRVVGEEQGRSIRPDAHVVEQSERAMNAEAVESRDVAVAEPFVVRLPPRRERHLAIVDAAGNVITAIEFLRLWNKVGERGRSRYLAKQIDYVSGGVNLVEVDLIRQGAYVLAAPNEELPEEVLAPYMMCVYRAEQPDQVEVYRAPLHERLPNIPIPLRPGERDAVLQLQPLVDACYEDGRYAAALYEAEPNPRLSTEDAQWADSLLRDKGLRT